MGRLVGQQVRVDCAFGTRRDADGAVLYLFEKIGFAAGTAEPEVFHAARAALVISRRGAGDVEDIDPPLPEVMERLAALWIRAMVDHGGPSPESRQAVFRIWTA